MGGGSKAKLTIQNLHVPSWRGTLAAIFGSPLLEISEIVPVANHTRYRLNSNYLKIGSRQYSRQLFTFSRYFGAARLDNIGLVLRHESQYLYIKVFSQKQRWSSQSYQLTKKWTLITVTWIDKGMLDFVSKGE